MSRPKTPLLLIVSAAALAATGFVASPARAATADCKITGAPVTTVSVGLDVSRADLSPGTNCPDNSQVQFSWSTTWPDGVPYAQQAPGFRLATNYDGNPKAVHDVEGVYPFGITEAGNVLAGQTMAARYYSAFVDADGDHLHDSGEPYFENGYDTTLTVLRATRITDFTASRTTVTSGQSVTFGATAQRADWETGSWRTFPGWAIYDLQFKADDAGDWTTVSERVGGYADISATGTASGQYRLKYRGDVVSGVSYSEPVHVTVS